MYEECKLCKQIRELRKSHIIPEWGYKNLYDSKHRLLHTSMYEKIVYPGYKQNGAKEYLLCEECERFLSKTENYSKHFYTSIKNGDLQRINNYFWLKKNMEHNKLKRFFLSIFYRMIISKDEMFKYYYLAENQIEMLRLNILKENLIPISFYPIVISKPYIMNKYVDDVLITQSCNYILHNYSTLWVVFDGLLATLIVSENIVDIDILNNSLKEGEFLVHKTNIDDIIDKDFVMKMFMDNKKVRDVYFP